MGTDTHYRATSQTWGATYPFLTGVNMCTTCTNSRARLNIVDHVIYAERNRFAYKYSSLTISQDTHQSNSISLPNFVF